MTRSVAFPTRVGSESDSGSDSGSDSDSDERGPASRRAQQKAETRARLLAAARSVFAEGSVVTTALDAVAAAAGVSKATLFFHFPDRRELLSALARELLAEMYRDLGTPAPESRRAFLRGYFEAMRDPRPVLLWEIGDVLSADGRPLPDAAYRHLKDELDVRLRAEGVPADRAARLTGVLAPAAFLVARRVAFGQASEAEIAGFLDDVDALVAP
jgi:AcrR family transcriptional regulator